MKSTRVAAARAASVALLVLLRAASAEAQLVDATQVSPTVPGGTIAKSLAEQVGAGHGDAYTPGSAVYLIQRDPARSIRRGRQLFQRKFTSEQGVGPRVSRGSTGNIRESRALGAGLSDSCAACHGRPRGSAGFGGDVVTRPDSRDAPHLFGLGLQEMLADEITRELRAIRARALRDAAAGGTIGSSGPRERWRCRRDPSRCGPRPPGPVTVALVAKGISFGRLTAFPDGTVDTTQVRGIDPDLRVRPFFHHGETISIREFVIGAFQAEMGLQAADPVLCAATDPAAPVAGTSPAGFSYEPSLDRFERPPGCDGGDPDADGVADELDPAVIDHLEFYLLNYFKPGLAAQTERTRRGRARMDTIGCTSCHVADLVIEADRRVADVETSFDPVRGVFNRLFATVEPRFAIVPDAYPNPRLLPAGERFVVRNLFTDFRRHDLGPAFHEREYDGTMQTLFLTEALWGVGSSPPYGHDGRSINLEEVILRHGGEAQASRDAFAQLGEGERRELLDFLGTLVLFPPDDTASNLNPGDPSRDLQDPAGHGTINLGVLFQLPEEGPE
jgi:hypothetical protein